MSVVLLDELHTGSHVLCNIEDRNILKKSERRIGVTETIEGGFWVLRFETGVSDDLVPVTVVDLLIQHATRLRICEDVIPCIGVPGEFLHPLEKVSPYPDYVLPSTCL